MVGAYGGFTPAAPPFVDGAYRAAIDEARHLGFVLVARGLDLIVVEPWMSELSQEVRDGQANAGTIIALLRGESRVRTGCGSAMTIDHSVTASEVLFITKLVNRVDRVADPKDARELARRKAEAMKRPDRRVANAFGIESSRDGRDRILRNLAGEGSLRKQASTVHQKTRRYCPHPTDQGTAGERGLLWQLHQIGPLDLSERQLRRILGGR
jgi:hypothetical protein